VLGLLAVVVAWQVLARFAAGSGAPAEPVKAT
jgi:hypothetical protein